MVKLTSPALAPLFQSLATMCEARENCDNNEERFERWTDRIESMVKEHMPRGSGFDNGTTIDLDESCATKLVFHTSFHHMDKQGGYDGWTNHTVFVTPCLAHGFNLRVTGVNRNDIKDYIRDTFQAVLATEVQKYGYDVT